MARYQLRKRWSSTNNRYGWVLWDTSADKAASAWHANPAHLESEMHRRNFAATRRAKLKGRRK